MYFLKKTFFQHTQLHISSFIFYYFVFLCPFYSTITQSSFTTILQQFLYFQNNSKPFHVLHLFVLVYPYNLTFHQKFNISVLFRPNHLYDCLVQKAILPHKQLKGQQLQVLHLHKYMLGIYLQALHNFLFVLLLFSIYCLRNSL